MGSAPGLALRNESRRAGNPGSQIPPKPLLDSVAAIQRADVDVRRSRPRGNLPIPLGQVRTGGFRGAVEAPAAARNDFNDAKDFDHMWLQMMIDHHSGAITMSNTELASGDRENVTMTNLPSQGDPQLLSRWSDSRGAVGTGAV